MGRRGFGWTVKGLRMDDTNPEAHQMRLPRHCDNRRCSAA
jgi:hypothetical protein